MSTQETIVLDIIEVLEAREILTASGDHVGAGALTRELAIHHAGVCKRGHKRTPENVYRSGACRLCVSDRNRKRDVAIVCANCGGTSRQRKDHALRPGPKFCSHRCSALHSRGGTA